MLGRQLARSARRPGSLLVRVRRVRPHNETVHLTVHWRGPQVNGSALCRHSGCPFLEHICPEQPAISSTSARTITMDVSSINWFAVMVATVSAFVLGGVWYSPALFGKRWMRENQFTEDDLASRNMGKVFGLAFLWTFIMALNLAFYLNSPETDAVWGAVAGFLVGFGWIAMGIFVIGLFEKKSAVHMLIDAGYMVFALVLMGVIIGAWG